MAELEHVSDAVRAALAKLEQRLRCEACGKAGAMLRVEDEGQHPRYRCRYCGCSRNGPLPRVAETVR